MVTDEWIDAVSKCIIAISEDLNRTTAYSRSLKSEKALEQLTEALIAAGKEKPDA